MRKKGITLFFCLLTIAVVVGQSPALLLDYQTSIEVAGRQRVVTASHLIQINNSDGIKYSNIEIPFAGDQKIKVKTVEIRDVNGKVLRKLKKNEIKERNKIRDIALYSDDFVKYFTPKWNTYPYQIFYEYEIKSNQFLFVANWIPLLSMDVPTAQASLKIAAPTDYEMAVDFPDTLQYHQTVADGRIIHKWEIAGFSAPKREAFAPYYYQSIPMVKVLPIDFHYSKKGKQDSWKNYGNWQHRIMEGLQDLPASEQKIVDELIEGQTDQLAIIQILYNYLQDNHRYVLVSIETGGLKPYPASYVCEKRYGDCKALTNYMKSLLDYVGIPSFYTKVYAGKRPSTVQFDLPGQQFNHVILGVPIAGDTIWLENTSDTYPAGYLGTFTQNRKAFWVDESNSRLVQLPALEAERPVEASRYHFKLDEKGSGTVTVETTARNQLYEAYAYFDDKDNPVKTRRYLERYFPVPNASLDAFEFDKPDRNIPEIHLTSHWTLQHQMRKVGKSLVLKPVAFADLGLEKPENRHQELWLNYPMHDSLTVIYELPFLDDYTVSLPEKVDIQTPYGQFFYEAKQVGNQLVMTQRRHIFSGKYNMKRYAGFYEMLRSEEKQLAKFHIILKIKQ